MARVTKAAAQAEADEAALAKSAEAEALAVEPQPEAGEEAPSAAAEAVDPAPIAQEEAAPVEPEYVPGLQVRTLQPSRRRAGLEFGLAWRAVPLSELTEEQFEALYDDPLLMVEFIDIPVRAD